mmetsp:Transcript_17719/g.38208  ORF Transcript_17719/g.38208 Transcript_17719/m.38208 type:complete len:80 (-) Transcript_17719:1633-1872(-)
MVACMSDSVDLTNPSTLPSSCWVFLEAQHQRPSRAPLHLHTPQLPLQHLQQVPGRRCILRQHLRDGKPAAAQATPMHNT